MLNKMSVMQITDKHGTNGSSDSKSDADIDQGGTLKPGSHLTNDMQRVMKSKEIINRRIVRIFKSKMGSSEQIDYLIAKQQFATQTLGSV